MIGLRYLFHFFVFVDGCEKTIGVHDRVFVDDKVDNALEPREVDNFFFFWSTHFQTTPVTRPNRPGATCRLQACGTKRHAPCWPCCCSASLCSSPYSPSPAPQAALGKPHVPQRPAPGRA
ncbi:Ephrin-A5b [Labeo rohita]|uniref:Ephrin-A5b n=1 Tax=Labeo rohita TaxID=84645 RepID=A0ABQ8MGF0_LABRO|nr:Ephrin-A5b [Labeo rohita]